MNRTAANNVVDATVANTLHRHQSIQNKNPICQLRLFICLGTLVANTFCWYGGSNVPCWRCRTFQSAEFGGYGVDAYANSIIVIILLLFLFCTLLYTFLVESFCFRWMRAANGGYPLICQIRRRKQLVINRFVLIAIDLKTMKIH